MESVEFCLGRSRFFMMGFIGIFMGAAFICVWLPIPWILKILSIIALVLYGRSVLNIHLRRVDKAAIVRIWQDMQGRWGYQTRSGRVALGELKGDSFKTPFCIILRLRFKTHHRSICIPRDALSTEEYRILSTRLSAVAR
jgi:hypothetical protein